MIKNARPEAGPGDLVIPYRRGTLRAREFVLIAAMAAAMATLVGWPGVVVALALVVLQIRSLPPRAGIWRFSPRALQNAKWLDQQCVVVAGSHREASCVVYRDEVAPELFCRLRRRCYGLPE